MAPSPSEIARQEEEEAHSGPKLGFARHLDELIGYDDGPFETLHYILTEADTLAEARSAASLALYNYDTEKSYNQGERTKTITKTIYDSGE